MTMDLERGESTEPLSPPSSSNVQPASPANGAEGSNDEAEGSSQPSPVDDASDEDDTSRRHDSAAHEEPAEPPVELPPPASFARIGLKGQGLSEADEVTRANAEVRAAIDALRGLLDGYPMLDVRVAETEAEVLEALKLYRDMNHLSLTGVTCEQVVDHVQSHTINLYYRPEPNEPEITVTAATFTMRQSTMMLRLLATHPRMTRKGFGRVTVHFLKELCRALHKNDILVYTYPSSAPFYKALHFRHTHLELSHAAKPSVAAAGEDAAAREAARDARRVFSAKENEMIFIVQPTMQQVIARACAASGSAVAHPYACTRRRAGASAAEDAAEEDRQRMPAVPAPVPAAAPPPPANNSAAANRSRRPAAGTKGGAKSRQQPEPPPPVEIKVSARATGKRGACSSSSSKRADAPVAPEAPVAWSAPVPRPVNLEAKREEWRAAVSPLFVPASESADAGSSSSSTAELGAPPASAAAQAARAILATMAAEASGSGPASGTDDAAEASDVSPRKRQRVPPKSKEVYQVEKILDVRRGKGKDVQYLIKWKGWASKHNTWEPVEHLHQALIDDFEAAQAQA